MGNLNFIESVIKTLKKEYGQSVTFRNATESINLLTGVRTPTNDEFTVAKVIIPPEKLEKIFIQDKILAGKQSLFYVDMSDIPTGKVINEDTKVLWNQKVFIIGTIRNYANKALILITNSA